MDYPFDPNDLVPPATVMEPEPNAYTIMVDLRNAQTAVINDEARTVLGAPTSQYPIEAYTFDEEYGSQTLNIDALIEVADPLAQALKAIIGDWPIVSALKPDPDAYWFIGQLWPDPENTTTPVNHATMAFMSQFFEKLAQYGYTFVESVAYEILNFFMPENWKQRNYNGNPALSGWVPPSCFIRPTSDAALNYLANVQKQVIREALAKGVVTKFQIGEPWWWDGSYSTTPEDKFAPCIYDEYTRAQYTLETGKPVPTPWITNIFDPLTPENEEYAYWLQEKLGASTNRIRDLVWAEFNTPDRHIDATLLFFTPQIMSPASELTNIMNFPVDHWKRPNYDFVQIEDYDWIIDGRLDLVPLTFDAAQVKLDYPREVVHYFTGFILNAWDYHIWPWIDKAIRMAKDANMPYIYVWSYTQAMRDSVVYGDALPSAMSVPIFDLPPNWTSGYQITREYRTELQISRGLKEVRRADRSVPRKSLQFTTLMAGRDKRKFDAFLATWQGFRFYMPEYVRFVDTTTDLAPTEISVQLERIPPWIQLGTVVLLSYDEKLSARIVDRLVPETNRIEFQAPDADGMTWPAGTRIYPALFGSLQDSISQRRINDRLSENMIMFNVVPGSEPATRNLAAPTVVFDGVEVWDKEPNWTGTPNITVATGVENVDAGVGLVQPFNFAPFTQRVTRYSYLNRGYEEVEATHAFLERMRGQQGVFWCPTWEADLEVLPGNVAGDVLRVEGDEIADFLANDSVLRNIMILDNEGGKHYFKIVSVAADGDNTAITVTPPLTAPLLARVDLVCWLILSRMASDSLTESWSTEDMVSFDLSIKSLQATEK